MLLGDTADASGIAAAGLMPVTLELLDRFTIAAVDDMNDLGLDRTAAAMLMIESDMPGVVATDELERAEAACRVAGATDVVRAADAVGIRDAGRGEIRLAGHERSERTGHGAATLELESGLNDPMAVFLVLALIAVTMTMAVPPPATNATTLRRNAPTVIATSELAGVR